MESINKFKVLTIVIFCLFVFVIGAIYTNTKDIADNRLNAEKGSSNEMQEPYGDIYHAAENSTDLEKRVDRLSRRIDELSQKVREDGQIVPAGSSKKLNCKVYGVESQGQVEKMSLEDALQDARMTNSNILLSCSL